MRHAIQKEWKKPKCLGGESLYVDYEKPPTRVEARALCRGCPLLELCDEAAQTRRPAWGVWGGRVYGSGNFRKPLDRN
ncbi:WhiB family transcriptional regulator [Leucobacter viscericola]|uniref:WhiB family transcriptional regulator n=1 Tax=Leucobacter viscericola TaxID=2714935 RepID=UPI003CC704BD